MRFVRWLLLLLVLVLGFPAVAVAALAHPSTMATLQAPASSGFFAQFLTLAQVPLAGLIASGLTWVVNQETKLISRWKNIYKVAVNAVFGAAASLGLAKLGVVLGADPSTWTSAVLSGAASGLLGAGIYWLGQRHTPQN